MIEFIFIVLKFIFLVAYFFGILLVLLASSIYFVGFLYDSIMGNLALKIGGWLAKKMPHIKNNSFLINIWKRIQPKETYLRYETPLFTYCFSFMAIYYISLVFPEQQGMQFIYASMIYLFCYFVGMRRKCGEIEGCYRRVLKNNKDFLKLSFLPITFIITVLGFCFTVTGLKLQEIAVYFIKAQNIFNQWLKYHDDANILMVIKLFILGLICLVLLYIISLPIQVISYFIISMIEYFYEHGAPYKRLFVKYIRILNRLRKKLN